MYVDGGDPSHCVNEIEVGWVVDEVNPSDDDGSEKASGAVCSTRRSDVDVHGGGDDVQWIEIE